MEKWSEKIQVKKGDYGERLVRKHLESKGWIIYEPVTDGAHGFDKLCTKDKKYIIIAEVKSKARMNKWNATGFNLKHYNEYTDIQNRYGIDIFIFFVDEYLKSIYGNKLSILQKPYIAKDGNYPRRIRGGIIIFSLEIMKQIYSLSDEEAKILKETSTRNYNYECSNGQI